MDYINLWLKWVGWRDWKFQLYWGLISTGSAVNFSFIQVVVIDTHKGGNPSQTELKTHKSGRK